MVLARDLFVATAELGRPLAGELLETVRGLGYRPRLLSAEEAALLPNLAEGAAVDVEPAVLTQALQRARARVVPLLVSVHAPWCAPCQQMQRLVWSAPAVRAALAGVEVLEVDADTAPAVAAWLQVAGLPDARLLSPEGKEIARLSGVVAQKEVLAAVERAKAQVGLSAAATGDGAGE